MVTREELNEDQRKSFAQLTMEAEFSDIEALELIDEFCIRKNMTGLRCSGRFQLTPDGRTMAESLRGIEQRRN